jgi:hypothetical protein
VRCPASPPLPDSGDLRGVHPHDDRKGLIDGAKEKPAALLGAAGLCVWLRGQDLNL